MITDRPRDEHAFNDDELDALYGLPPRNKYPKPHEKQPESLGIAARIARYARQKKEQVWSLFNKPTARRRSRPMPVAAIVETMESRVMLSAAPIDAPTEQVTQEEQAPLVQMMADQDVATFEVPEGTTFAVVEGGDDLAGWVNQHFQFNGHIETVGSDRGNARYMHDGNGIWTALGQDGVMYAFPENSEDHGNWEKRIPIAKISEEYYLDPQKLLDATTENTESPAELSVHGTTLNVNLAENAKTSSTLKIILFDQDYNQTEMTIGIQAGTDYDLSREHIDEALTQLFGEHDPAITEEALNSIKLNEAILLMSIGNDEVALKNDQQAFDAASATVETYMEEQEASPSLSVTTDTESKQWSFEVSFHYSNASEGLFVRLGEKVLPLGSGSETLKIRVPNQSGRKEFNVEIIDANGNLVGIAHTFMAERGVIQDRRAPTHAEIIGSAGAEPTVSPEEYTTAFIEKVTREASIRQRTSDIASMSTELELVQDRRAAMEAALAYQAEDAIVAQNAEGFREDFSAEFASALQAELEEEISGLDAKEEVVLQNIQISNQELLAIQGKLLYQESVFYINGDQVEPMLAAQLPWIFPANMEEFLQQESASRGWTLGQTQDWILSQQSEYRSIGRDLLAEYELRMSELLNQAVDAHVRIASGEEEAPLKTALFNQANTVRGLQYITEAASTLGIVVPDNNAIWSEGDRLSVEQRTLLLHMQSEEERLHEIEEFRASNASWQLAHVLSEPDPKIYYTRPPASLETYSEEEIARINRAQRLVETALSSSLQARVQLVAQVQSGKSVEFVDGIVQIAITDQTLLDLNTRIANAISNSTDTSDLQVIVNREVTAAAAGLQIDGIVREKIAIDERLEFGSTIEAYLDEHTDDLIAAFDEALGINPGVDPMGWLDDKLAQYLENGTNPQRASEALQMELEKVKITIANELAGNLADAIRLTAELNNHVNPYVRFVAQASQKLKEINLAKATSRNGATTDAEIAAYQAELEDDQIFTMSNSLRNGTGGKPLTVLVMGNHQTLDPSESEATGMLAMYEDLQDDNDVIIFRVGNAMDELAAELNLSFDFSLHSSVVQQHMENMLEDIMKSRGEFSGRQAPTKVILAGYSWGGGAVEEALSKWDQIGNNIEIAGTALIDGVRLGLDDYGRGVSEVPQHTGKHLQIWQDNNLDFLNIGAAPVHGSTLGYTLTDQGDYRTGGSTDGRIQEMYIEDINHLDIDDSGPKDDPTFVYLTLKKYLQDLLDSDDNDNHA